MTADGAAPTIPSAAVSFFLFQCRFNRELRRSHRERQIVATIPAGRRRRRRRIVINFLRCPGLGGGLRLEISSAIQNFGFVSS